MSHRAGWSRRAAAPLSCVACALLLPHYAGAFRREVSEHGSRLRWSSPTLVVQIPTTLPGLPADAAEVIASALDAWTRPACTSLRFALASKHTEAAVTLRVVRGEWTHPPQLAAWVDRQAHADSGVMHSARIDINPAYRFSTSRMTASGAVDLQSVITHEIGHVLGLAHSRKPSAVMHQGTQLGAAPLRELTADDIAAVCALFPSHSPKKGSARAN